MIISPLVRFRPAPLSSGFFLAAILGLLVTLFYFDALASTRTGKNFALAFIVLFVLMFIASIISMRRAPAGAQIALDHHMTKAKEGLVRTQQQAHQLQGAGAVLPKKGHSVVVKQAMHVKKRSRQVKSGRQKHH